MSKAGNMGHLGVAQGKVFCGFPSGYSLAPTLALVLSWGSKARGIEYASQIQKPMPEGQRDLKLVAFLDARHLHIKQPPHHVWSLCSSWQHTC